MAEPILPEVTGHTRMFAILADPIGHIRTPQAINRWCREQGVDAVMMPVQVAPANLALMLDAFRAMKNLDGFVVTVPHKVAIVDLLDEVAPHARAIGAVNCVRREADGRLIGTMLDGLGFVEGLRRHGIDPSGMSVYLAGAGGAANAVAFALAEAGITRLAIANRTRDKVVDLAHRLAAHCPALAVEPAPVSPGGFDLVVNATSLGLRSDDPLPLDISELAPAQIVADVIMNPDETALLLAARARGCRIHKGHPMLLAQVDLMARHMRASR